MNQQPRRERSPTRLLLSGSRPCSKYRRSPAARPLPAAAVASTAEKLHSSPVQLLMNQAENVAVTLACGLTGDIVRTFGEVRLRVFGTSMVPSILPGDLISVERAEVTEISNGEVVLYSREGRLFAHRVVGRAGSGDQSILITRGDRLRYNDPPVSSGELLGRVISIERGDRQVDTFAKATGLNRPLIRLLQASDRATYLYLRLASLWGTIVGRISRTEKVNVGGKVPAHGGR